MMDDFEKNFMRSVARKAFRNCLIFGLILVTIWAVLLAFVPNGWWITAINIGFLIITVIGIAVPSTQFLKVYMPLPLAIIASAAIWLILVVFIRSIILELLGVI